MQSDELADKIKDILCHHYGVSLSTSRLQISKTNLIGFSGRTVHYHLILTNGEQRFRTFGKVIPTGDKPSCNTVYGTFTPTVSTEYNNLQYLAKLTPEQEIFFPRLIELVNAQKYSLLLLEYLEGYSNLSTTLSSLILPRRERITQIIEIGKSVLNKLNALQGNFSDINYFSLEPECKALMDKLDRIYSLSSETKKNLSVSITERAGKLTRVRKGIIHGDLGPRNILIGRSDVVFLDWEAMQKNRFSLYDSCYFVISLLMRCVQVFISQSQLDHISMVLFRHMINLEKSEATMEEQFVRDGVWLGKYLAQFHVLSSYERQLREGGLHPFFRQRRRQIQFLVNMISRDAYDDKIR